MLKRVKAQYNHLVRRHQWPIIKNPGKSHIPAQQNDFCQDKCLTSAKSVIEDANAELIRHKPPVRGNGSKNGQI